LFQVLQFPKPAYNYTGHSRVLYNTYFFFDAQPEEFTPNPSSLYHITQKFMDQFLNVTDAGTNNPSDMDVMSWFIIILLTCAPFVVFGCVSCTIFCIDCNENGEVVVLKFGCGARKRMIQKSIVTKVRKIQCLPFLVFPSKSLHVFILTLCHIDHEPNIIDCTRTL
jgi:hypothetical protein